MTNATQTANQIAEINPTPTSPPEDGRITVKGSLLERAKADDMAALKMIFHQFIPADEEITFAEYYGYTGFAYVGSHSFACLTDKRVATLKVGPFKKIYYNDGFLENMTSGGVYQPSKFWLYVWMFFGFFIGLAFFGFMIANALYYGGTFLGLIDPYYRMDNLLIVSGILALPLVPFFMNAIISTFYGLYPCGLACWVRERYPVVVSVSRNKMMKANRLYRKWSDLRDVRMRFIKNKMKFSTKE